MFTVAKDSFRTSIYSPKIDLVKEFKEIGFQNDDFHAEMQLSEIVLIMKIKTNKTHPLKISRYLG